MEIKKDMSPGINTVLQEGIYKTEWENFQKAYLQAKQNHDSKELQRLYDLAHSLTSRNVRFGPPSKINPYFEDMFNKKEFNEFREMYEKEIGTASSERKADLREMIMDLSGRGRPNERVNPYFKDMMDKQEYDALMKQVNTANRDQNIELAQETSKRISKLRYKNPYLKDYLDKIQFDKIMKEIEIGKKSNNMEKLNELRKEMLELSGRDPNVPDEEVNSYMKDFADKQEFESLKQGLERAEKQSDSKLRQELLQKAKERAGLFDTGNNRPNQYLRQYFDEIQAKKYMQEQESARKSGDMSNYHRITSVMQHLAGDMGYTVFKYSPSIEQTKTENSSFRDSIVLPKDEQNRLAEKAKEDAKRIENESKTHSTTVEGPEIE